MKEKREVIEGYVIDSSIWIGNKRVCFGISENTEEKHPYMICIFESEGYIFPVCDRMFCSDDFSEALTTFANKIIECAKVIEEHRNTLKVDDPTCLKEADVISAPWDTSIKDKVVAVTERSLEHGYRDIAHQLFYVNGGFGVEANSRGRACYGWNIYTGEKCRIERHNIMGIVPKEKLPNFAKKTLEKIKGELKREDKDAR